MSKTRKTLLSSCLVTLALAVGAYFLGREQDRIRSLYGEAPQTITVADLAAKGYGDNVWVDLTEVEVGPKSVVSMRGGTMSAVWVPAFPKGQANQAKTIQVVLRTTRARSDAEASQRFAGKSSFRGAVINPTLLKPYDPYRPLLQQQYPNLALAPTIWEVDIEYDKPSAQWAQGFYIGAAALGVIALLCGGAWLASALKPALAQSAEERT